MKDYSFDIRKLPYLKNNTTMAGFIFLEKYFIGCSIQYIRIKEAKIKIKKHSIDSNFRLGMELKRLFLEIHFYLICWANVMKILRKLDKLIDNEKFREIFIKYEKELKKFIEFRTYLEHLIEDLDNKKKKSLLKNPFDIGNLENNFFTFGGKKLYIGKKNLEILGNLYNDLNEWLEYINRVEGVS